MKRHRYNQVNPKQNAVNRARTGVTKTYPFVAQIRAVYSDRNTCDIKTRDGAFFANVPVLGSIWLDGSEEVWGTVELPEKENWIVALPIDSYGEKIVVLGTVVPFLYSKYKTKQTPVSSSNKQFTQKLLEKGKEKTYRKIFAGGTSVEVQSDGSLIVEFPSGTYIQRDESSGETKIVDDNGNNVTMGSSSVTINDNFEVLQ